MDVMFHCPHCGKIYELENFIEGAEIECPNCKMKIVLSASLLVKEQAQGEIIADNAPKRKRQWRKPRMLVLALLAMLMYVASGFALWNGLGYLHYVPVKRFEGLYVNDDRYSYYGDMISHLHYKAALEQVFQTKKVADEIKRLEFEVKETTVRQKGLLWLNMAACLFVGASIVLAIRQGAVFLERRICGDAQ